MFLFDPEFRYHPVDEPLPNASTGNYAANVMIGNQGEQICFHCFVFSLEKRIIYHYLSIQSKIYAIL